VTVHRRLGYDSVTRAGRTRERSLSSWAWSWVPLSKRAARMPPWSRRQGCLRRAGEFLRALLRRSG